jgi:hypothetical protein
MAARDRYLPKTSNVAVLLHDDDVFLALLNGCDAGISSTNDAGSGVAGVLVKAGVPTVMATVLCPRDSKRFIQLCVSKTSKCLSGRDLSIVL